MARKRKRQDDDPKMHTFTKKWVNRCMTLSWICIFLSFGLAFLGKVEIAEQLSTAIVINIIGVMLGYFAKSFFETREQKAMEFKHKVADYDNSDVSTEDEDNSEDSVG